MQLKPLYRLHLTFGERWSVSVVGDAGREDQVFHMAQGHAEGTLAGNFRAVDYPRGRTDGTVVTDLRGVLETPEGASILVECHGFGRRHTPDYDQLSGGPRQWVVSVTHLSEAPEYLWLNDSVCVGSGHSPRRSGSGLAKGSEFVLDVAELLWEPLPE